MTFNALSDIDPVALSIVKRGANRKQFFLRKAAADETLMELPAETHELIKGEGWSTVYCVVAEPGAFEDSGIGGTDIPDQWADEDEIRKAAHRFAANGGLINKMHETLDPYGVMVENAVALSDFEVGEQVIKQGSWYIAIQPNEHGRDEIEKGNFTGVSIEGTGIRTLVEKGADSGNEPTTILAKIRDLFEGESKQITKGASFADRLAADKLTDELPDGMDLLRSLIWDAVYDADEDDPMPLIRASVTEFADWCEGLLATPEGMNKQAALVKPEGSTDETRTKDSEMPLTPEEKTELVDEITKGVAAEIAKQLPTVEDSEPTLESVSKALADAQGLEGEELNKRLDEAEAAIKKLGAGGSAQNDEDPKDEPISKADIRAAFENEGVDPALMEVI